MVRQWKDEESTKEFKKEVDVKSGRSTHLLSLVLQNVYIFAVIENGSRPCWLLLYIRKSGYVVFGTVHIPNLCYMDCDEEK